MTRTSYGDSPLCRLSAWLPALVLAQLGLALWAASRALPVGDGSSRVIAVAVGNQLLFLLRVMPLLFLLSWPLAALRSPRAARLAVGVLWSLFLLLEAVLEQYTLTAGTALGADLLGYGVGEIRTTVRGAATHGMDVPGWIGMLLPLGLLWLGLDHRLHLHRLLRPALLPVVLLVGMAAWWLPMAVGVRGLGNDAARTIATSKGAYFIADSWRWWRGPSIPAPVVAASEQEPVPGRAVVDPDYPFLHAENTPNALGPYFNATRDGQPPNIVVIVVEGLGRSFSGPDAALGSFTPFLDELATHSLYFDNVLANQGRTFGVMPALFGSLPLAEQGFAALGKQMPAHAGLFNVLQRQGYRSVFYAGTDLDFDNQRAYLELQGVDEIVDLESFGPGYQRNPADEWGYPDRELVTRVLADTARLRPPFVAGIQTISMHTLYVFPGQAAYKRKLEQRLDALDVPIGKRARYRKQADIYSAILYSDDQLRRYFETVARAPWYANTIFVITGDHRLAEIPQDTHIERYHVPLIVYSPLLRKPARIRAVSSHLDVTPSLLALMSGTYGLQRPARVAWLGNGLDMAGTFRSLQAFPIKQTKTSVPDFVAGRWFLHDGRVFELRDGIDAAEVDDAGLRMQVTRRFQAHLAANAAFLRRMALSPEGDAPQLVAFQADAEPPPGAASVLDDVPSGLSVAEVTLRNAASGPMAVATFVNGDATDAPEFVPFVVLTAEDGRELGESYGEAIQLRANARREVQLPLPTADLQPGRYYFSVIPSHPETGKRLGRGRYRIPLDLPEQAR